MHEQYKKESSAGKVKVTAFETLLGHPHRFPANYNSSKTFISTTYFTTVIAKLAELCTFSAPPHSNQAISHTVSECLTIHIPRQ
jgi:hypothetical protein